jgi:hypothetical protein
MFSFSSIFPIGTLKSNPVRSAVASAAMTSPAVLQQNGNGVHDVVRLTFN